ncbi:MAG: hypothetical protein ACFCU1_09720 [Sumerlaeia bacterium]
MSALGFYELLTKTYWLAGFSGKLTFLLIFVMLLQPAFKKRDELVLALFGAQFIMLAYNLFTEVQNSLPETMNKTTLLILVILSFVLALCMVITAIKPEGSLQIRWRGSALQWLGVGAVGFGFFYPLFTQNLVQALFASSVSILPHPTLYVILGVMLLVHPNAPRLAMLSAAVGAIALGVVDYRLGINSTVPLALLGAFLLGLQVFGAIRTGGVLQDDLPPVDVERFKKSRAVVSKKADKERTWKLK